MDKVVKDLLYGDICVLENVDLKRLSTIRTGGIGRLLIYPKTEEELVKAVNILNNREVDFALISGGSNTLFPDGIMRKALISTKYLNSVKETDNGLSVGAGARIGEVIAFAKKNGLSGLEKFVGVPAAIGGMVKNNFGCYFLEIKDLISAVYALKDGEIRKYSLEECGFSYRNSVFGKDLIVTKCELALTPKAQEIIEDTARTILYKRKISQPLEKPSLGSVFKKVGGVSAGKIIDECGLKGMKIGGAAVSEKHAGFIVNLGHADTFDVLQLIDIIREKVYNSLKIDLETEINIEETN